MDKEKFVTLDFLIKVVNVSRNSTKEILKTNPKQICIVCIIVCFGLVLSNSSLIYIV